MRAVERRRSWLRRARRCPPGGRAGAWSGGPRRGRRSRRGRGCRPRPPRSGPRAGAGAGERALLVAEELALDQRGGEGGDVDGDEGRPLARPVIVDGAGHQLLAGAALAGDEHRDGRGGGPADRLPHPEHARALADERGVALARRAGGGGGDGGRLHRAAKGVEERVEVEGLGDVVERPELHRVDGALAVPVGGGHHHRKRRVGGAQLGEQLDAVAVLEAHVEEDAVDAPAEGARRGPRPRPRPRGRPGPRRPPGWCGPAPRGWCGRRRRRGSWSRCRQSSRAPR